MTGWVGPTITAAGVIVAAVIGAWASLRIHRWSEARKRQTVEREVAERKAAEERKSELARQELDQRRRELAWRQFEGVAKGVAWILEKRGSSDEGNEESKNDEEE